MHFCARIRSDALIGDGVARAAFGCDTNGKPCQAIWATWRWDGQALVAEVDRYGMYPIFYATLSDGIAISDSIAELIQLGAPVEFDDDAMAAFLRLGFFLAEDTPFLAIRAMPPGGSLHWQAGHLQVNGRLIPRVADTGISREEAADGYVTLFRAAIGNNPPADSARCVLPLSGGRDSRHIALELHRRGIRPGLVLTQHHFPSRTDEDATVARAVCDALGWPHTAVAQTGDPVASELEKNRLFDCLTDEHTWFLPSVRVIRATDIDTVYDGLAGDALSQSIFCARGWGELVAREGLESLGEAIRHTFGADDAALQALLKPQWYARWDEARARARILKELRRHESDENVPDRFMFWNRTRREIAPFLIRYLPGVRVITPYLDEALFDFLWNLPGAITGTCDFHDAALHAGYPAFSHIPFERKTVAAPDPRAHHAALMRGMARRVAYWKDGNLLNRGWLRPRLLKAMISPGGARNSGWYVSWLSWLRSLEMLAATPVTASRRDTRAR